MSPGDDLGNATLSVQADVFDAGVGLGSTATDVQNNSVITINTSNEVPDVTDLGNGYWRISLTNFPVTVDGWFSWSITVQDTLGNQTSSDTYWLLVDTTGPVISNASPIDIPGNVGPVVLFQADIYDAHMGIGLIATEVQDNSKITVGGVDYVPDVEDLGNGNWRISRTLTAASEGSYLWNMAVTDRAGNETVLETRWFLVDTSPPVVSNISPSLSFTGSQNVTLQADIYDSGIGIGLTTESIAGYSANYITIDGENYFPTVSDLGSGGWRFSANVNLTEGAHTWGMTVQDFWGHETVIGPYTLTVDLTGPVITLLYPLNSTINTTSATVLVSVSDALTGVGSNVSSVEANVVVIVDSTVYPSIAVDNGNGVWIVGALLDGLTERYHAWGVLAYDRVGNVTQSPIYGFTVDTGS
jgi:hypothetical protein